MPNKADLSVEVARTPSAVAALRHSWRHLPRNPNADVDYYLAVLASRKEILRPHVVVLKQDGAVRSILVGRIERTAVEVGLGYKKLRLSNVRCLTLIYSGMLGDDSEETALANVKSVMSSLKAGEADIAWFNHVRTGSAVYHAAVKGQNFLSRDHFPVMNQHWRLRLPATYEALHQRLSSNTRHNVKRYSKRLLDTFKDRLTVKSFRNCSEVEQTLKDTEAIASKSYHRGLGAGFVNNTETQRIWSLAAREDWLRAYLLYIDEKPVAFWNGLLYGKTFFTGTTGFDSAFGEYRPGIFLLRKMVEDLCQENVADAIDFGFGDAQYKRDWCDENWQEASIFLFSPTFKGALLNATRTPLLALSKSAQHILAHVGLLARVKRLWRDRLEGKEQQA